MQIHVEKLDEKTFRVEVAGPPATTHTVTVEPGYYEKLTGGSVPVETLIEKSFEFLLEREPNTSILRRFSLPVIQSYFPEYESTIRRMLG